MTKSFVPVITYSALKTLGTLTSSGNSLKPLSSAPGLGPVLVDQPFQTELLNPVVKLPER
jgi:hypothetical protein